MAYTTIDKPSDYFNTVTWTGTNDATTSVTGVNFKPDWVWIKNRNVGDDHVVHDGVRGVTKQLFPSSSGAEQTNSEGIQSFDTDGFTTGTHRSTGGHSGNGMVAWNWLASNTTASNTAGNITSTVSVNTTAGISIGTYSSVESNTGKTVGHGLGSKPDMVMVKFRSGTRGWVGWHQGLTGGNEEDRLIALNSNSASNVITDYWGSGFNSTTFGLWDLSGDNSATGDYWFFAFKSVKGYSKFGSYTGNGSTDGTFVYTGFKPVFVMVKSTGTEGWYLYDTKRTLSNGGNPVDRYLVANDYIGEGTFAAWDYLSNGFKARQNWSGNNTSGQSYIYMAFAENPFVTSSGIPACAR